MPEMTAQNPIAADGPRSRRALLAAAAGGAAALAAALARPPIVGAAVGDPIKAGKSTSAGGAKTTLTNNSNTHQTLFVQQNGRHTAIQGYAPKGTAGRFTTNSKNKFALAAVNNAGAYGDGAAIRADGNENYGVWASSGPSIGVYGSSNGGPGVYGSSSTYVGIFGYANSGTGVYAGSSTGTALNVEGKARFQSYVEVNEIADPGVALANHARIYARDSGGKTQLCVVFQSGAVQVLATEP